MMLREFLDAYNIRTIEFAFRCGVSEQSLYAYMNGSRKPLKKTAKKIERESGGRVTIAELRGEEKKDERTNN